jgi:ABC-type transport system substrate-binding protein
VLAAQLVTAGFDVTAVPVTSADLVGSVLPGGFFDLVLAPLEASEYPSTSASYFSTASSLTGTMADLDWSGFDDTHIDTLLTQAAQQVGSNQSQLMYQQVDQALWVAMPSLPLFAEPTLLASSAWVGGVQGDPGGLGPLYSAASWFRIVASHPKSSAASPPSAKTASSR